MYLNILDKIGDWNPQLLREIKGQLKPFNVIFAFIISLVGQVGLLLYHLSQYPTEKYPMQYEYCNLGKIYRQQLISINKLLDQTLKKIKFFNSKQNYDLTQVQNFQQQLEVLKGQKKQLDTNLSQQSCPISEINFSMWWQDHWQYIFLTLCIVFIYTLLVAGTYLIVNNLAQEERRGTLNFIRLSPQSEISILIGKILGVPSVIYLITIAAIPLHIWSGISAKVPLKHIFIFYVILAASCFFFYSATLLFGLISNRFSSFSPWLASGAVVMFLITTMQFTSHTQNLHNTAIWLRLLSPFDMTKYLLPNLFGKSSILKFQEVQFFYIPFGRNVLTFLGLCLLNYGFGLYWIWQALKRRFRNHNATLISKGQSYLLVACFQIYVWGFTLQYTKNSCPAYLKYTPINCYYDLNHQISQNLGFLVLFNLILIIGLLLILSPHRQQIQDWARYRHQQKPSDNTFNKNYLWRDLVRNDKSPVLVTMMICLFIITIPLVVWIVLAPALNIHHNNSIDWVNSIGRMKAILGIAMFIAIAMIHVTIAQRMLLLKTPKRGLWAIAAIGIVMFVPPMIFSVLSLTTQSNNGFWLFSAFPWLALEQSATIKVFLALLAEFAVLVLLNLHLINQVKLAGESATKALLVGR